MLYEIIWPHCDNSRYGECSWGGAALHSGDEERYRLIASLCVDITCAKKQLGEFRNWVFGTRFVEPDSVAGVGRGNVQELWWGHLALLEGSFHAHITERVVALQPR